MLAYVFVHQAAANVDTERYVARLTAFHRALAAAPPAGFIESRIWYLRTGPLGRAFEDWYLVADWTALGALNQAAVTGERRPPHDEVAALSGDGAGAIYRLSHGAPNLDADYRTRATKPAGVPYEVFRPQLHRATGADGAVWQRQMVLGPDAEFLIDTAGPPQPEAFDHPVEVTTLQRVYPESQGEARTRRPADPTPST